MKAAKRFDNLGISHVDTEGSVHSVLYLEALNSAFEESEEGGVWIDGLSLFKDRFGFC